jgi:hybrid cluster-associated redox disulfide protein
MSYIYSPKLFILETRYGITRRHNMNTERRTVTKDSVIGDVIREVPGARDIIQKYFGGGCFTCPGINMESLSFGSMMHNLDPDKIVNEINRLAADEATSAREG